MKRKVEPFIPIKKLKREFNVLFSLLDVQKKKALWEELMIRDQWTQESLIERARDERLLKPIGQGGRLCPLCEFSSYEAVDFNSLDNTAVVCEIQKERPDWKPEMGCCVQCLEMYQWNNQAVANF
jgi:hypothetical protein